MAFRRSFTILNNCRALAAIVFAIALSGCGPSKPLTPAQKGRIVYMSNCVRCHNPNPNLPGSQGPPIAGSSRKLVEYRVMRVAYPPGYKPKRATHKMKPLPQLKDEVGNIAAFLAEVKQAGN